MQDARDERDKERVDTLIPLCTHTEDYYHADFGPHPYRW